MPETQLADKSRGYSLRKSYILILEIVYESIRKSQFNVFKIWFIFEITHIYEIIANDRNCWKSIKINGKLLKIAKLINAIWE